MAVELGRDMDSGEHRSGGGDAPLSREVIADLHAGLLSDHDAAVLRERISEDPDASRWLAALERVEADVAALGAAPADEPPADTTDAIVSALQAAPRHEVTGTSGAATHAARPPRTSAGRLRTIGWVTGLIAVLVAVGVGTVALLRLPASPAASVGPSAKYITVQPPAPAMPLTDPEIVALLDSPPDFGPLDDAGRRASCLNGLGYGAGTSVLGAASVQVNRVDAVLLVLAAENPGELVALVVPGSCSTVDTGLIADHVLEAP